MAYSRWNIINDTDVYMCRERFSLPRGSYFHPSEASVKWTDHHGIERVSGSCLRQSWFKLTKTGNPEPTSAYSQWIFELGKAVEKILVKQYTGMGILVEHNIPFIDVNRNIKGEWDVVVRSPEGHNVTLEVKSFYGYYATKDIMGNTKQVGHPKTGQLLQTLIYIHLGKTLGKIEYGKMIYYARDSASRRDFDIDLIPEGNTFRPTIDGITDYRFTMDDIYKRYEELGEYFKLGTMPPRDYELTYSPQKIEQLRAVGEISDSAYKLRKSKPLGDWQCNYCPNCKYCWSLQG